MIQWGFRVIIQEYKISSSDLQREAEFVADSIAPEAVKGTWLKEILQAKLDALVLQDEHYKWLYMNLRASVLGYDWDQSCLHVRTGVDPSVEGREIAEAVKLAESEEKMAEITKAMHAAAINYHRDRERHPAVALGTAAEAKTAGTAAVAAGTAGTAGTAAAAGTAEVAAVASAFVACSCCYDVLFKFILLECGYIAKLYPRHEEAAYIEMLRALLTGANTVDFKVTLCKQILKATGSQTKTAYDVLYTIIPALVQTMRSKEATNTVFGVL
ncbi:hypothetical protein ACSSS7_005120 [Eimeria intestinalis]